jgi:hypothetical protein
MEAPALVWSNTGKAMSATPADEVDPQLHGVRRRHDVRARDGLVRRVVVAVDNLSGSEGSTGSCGR